MQIGDGGADDIEGILAIYNDAVANTTALWNEIMVDHANRAAWLADRQRIGYPVLVAVDVAGAVLERHSLGDAVITAPPIQMSAPSCFTATRPMRPRAARWLAT